MIFILAALVLLTFTVTVGSPQLFAAEKEQMSQQKDQYRKSMEERLAKLGKELDELQAKAGATAVQARKDMDKYLAEAEKKRKAAFRKFDQMETESARKWKKFTHEMNEAADEFEKAYERAKSHFKE
jgi:hypothetical protein